jgi:hypothetical protein
MAEHYFKWGFVRNPYDRILSAYFYLHKFKMYIGRTNIRNLSFEDFVIRMDSWLPLDFYNPLIYPDVIGKYNFHIIPSVFFMKSPNLKMDFIGKVENIVEDWTYVCKQIELFSGKKIVKSLGRRNSSNNSKEKRKLITKELKKKIDMIYDADFLTYGYKKEL